MEVKSCLKNIWVSVVKNRCSHSGLKTLKLAVSQEGWNKLIFGVLIKIQKSQKSKMGVAFLVLGL